MFNTKSLTSAAVLLITDADNNPLDVIITRINGSRAHTLASFSDWKDAHKAEQSARKQYGLPDNAPKPQPVQHVDSLSVFPDIASAAAAYKLNVRALVMHLAAPQEYPTTKAGAFRYASTHNR